MAVFLPLPGSELDLKLRERARNQSASEEQTQTEFLKRVRQRSCQPFESLQELSSRVTRKLWSWKGGGLLAMAATPAPPPPTRPRPTDEDIFALGRRRHQLQFEDTLGLLLSWPVPRVAGFLLHGPKGHGHEALTSRFGRLLENSLHASTRHLVLHLGVPWQGNNHTALAVSLAKKLGLDSAPDSPADLGREIQAVLETNDVLPEIRQAQKFDGGLSRFLQDFWRPLASGVKRPSPFRFICLISHVGDADLEGDHGCQSPPSTDCDASGYDPAKVIRLPRLDPFARGEIALWSRRWFQHHEAAAQHLFEETRGHPVDLHNLLKDDALWFS